MQIPQLPDFREHTHWPKVQSLCIVTKIDNTNDCRVMAPLRGLLLLPDKKSYLALANYFIAQECNLDNFEFSYSDNLRTLFAVPKHKGGIVATCGGI